MAHEGTEAPISGGEKHTGRPWLIATTVLVLQAAVNPGDLKHLVTEEAQAHTKVQQQHVVITLQRDTLNALALIGNLERRQQGVEQLIEL
ncbi:hypothetical protein SKAU_G00106530 [Synaphobranchus kaupii]|uniref:Uncharacterized protein n=1 Tax=Synaphobranchus kaupii TaxID=118154 RepID=A0A9Q1FZL1_SYNKA|nr:hypothetical protein SKAU_G00106530 [Synaphobranchus kaupii]